MAFFPGCSLKDSGRALADSAAMVMDSLGYPLVELDRWNCCGTVFSLSQDDLIHHIGPLRNLIQAEQAGATELVTLCSMCFNTMKRSARFLEADPERLYRLNRFLDDEPDYEGGVEVLHLLEVLGKRIGWEAVRRCVQQPLEGVRIANYYGCMLLRPRGVGIDDPDHPILFEGLISALGAEPVAYPFQGDCCGGYQCVDRMELVVDQSYRILKGAFEAGAQVLATSCPLCHHNLVESLEVLQGVMPGDLEVCVLYFTELMAAAYGLETEMGSLFDTRLTLEGWMKGGERV